MTHSHCKLDENLKQMINSSLLRNTPYSLGYQTLHKGLVLQTILLNVLDTRHAGKQVDVNNLVEIMGDAVPKNISSDLNGGATCSLDWGEGGGVGGNLINYCLTPGVYNCFKA